MHPSAKNDGSENVAQPLVIRLEEPEWDVSTCERLEQRLAPAIDHADVVVLEMSAVRFMDSTCLGKLVRMYRLRVTGRMFEPTRLVVASPQIRHLFALVKFDELFPIFDTLDEALLYAPSED
ncbi:MAG: STAS domain-containing protein [Candidatus Tumulicola sp.]